MSLSIQIGPNDVQRWWCKIGSPSCRRGRYGRGLVVRNWPELPCSGCAMPMMDNSSIRLSTLWFGRRFWNTGCVVGTTSHVQASLRLSGNHLVCLRGTVADVRVWYGNDCACYRVATRQGDRIILEMEPDWHERSRRSVQGDCNSAELQAVVRLKRHQ